MEHSRAVEAHNGGVKAQKELWRVCNCTPVVADLHQFDSEQDPDPHHSERSDPDLHQSEKSHPGDLQEREKADPNLIKAMRIRNTK